MLTLALDLGLKTGWALGTKDGRLIASGEWDLAPAKQRRFEGGGMRWMRLRNLIGRLWCSVTDPAGMRIAFEEVRRHKGVDAAHAYGGALATLTSWCEEFQVPYEGIPVGVIKKSATGKGNASKEAMILAARRLFPDIPAISGDNEADALCLLSYMTQEEK
jgi:Holliday junction resolvasome RuvABC endonuclease subunit